MQKRLLLRVLMILALTALLAIPLWLIRGVVSERQQRQAEVEETIASSTGGQQRMIGPVLVVPYTESMTNAQGIVETVERRTTLLPDTLRYDGVATVEKKYKGIYKALIYQSVGTWVATFQIPANLGLDTPPARLVMGRAYLAMGLSDTHGVRTAPVVTWDNEPLAVSNGSQVAALGDGLHGDIGVLDVRAARQAVVKIQLDLAGTGMLSIAPLGKTTTVKLRSNWPHPNFKGRFLPQASQIDANGFSAQWEVPQLASGNSTQLTQSAANNRALETFDVAFIEPLNIYQQAERAVKYGLLFITLTFAAFFLFEVLRPLRIHPLQYGLVGLALALFFLLLISLSEHIAFGYAYLAASAASVALITFYLAHILGGRRHGAAFGGSLALLYAALYGLLQSEDNALMLGAMLLFAVLAALMVLTRKVDWYRLGVERV